MPYQVSVVATKDSEFEKYLDALRELGLSTERDANGRVGVVSDRATAEAVLQKVMAKVRYLPWQIIEVEQAT